MPHTLRRATVVALAALALSTSVARAEAVKIPATAAEHMAMSRTYLEKAAAWRAEAAYHRDMAAEYRRSHPDRKSGARNPFTVEMERHCMTIVTDVERLAADADDLAKFHRLRALELEGK